MPPLFQYELFPQANEEYFTFTEEEVSISIVTPPLTKTIALTKGLRQTLLIPSDINQEWVLVSDMNTVYDYALLRL